MKSVVIGVSLTKPYLHKRPVPLFRACAHSAEINSALSRLKARYAKAVAIGALAVIGAMSPCQASDNPLFNVFKSGISGAAKMSDVAVKYMEIKDSINVNGLDFSPDGKHLATSSYAQSSEVHVWDWEAKKIVLKLNREGAANHLMSEGIRYSPDGRFLAVCHDRGVKPHIIHVFDAKTGQLIKEINDPIPGACYGVGFTPDSQLMLRIARRGPISGDNVIAYSTQTWEPSWGLVTKPFAPMCSAVSPDGKYAAIGGIDLGPGVADQPRILIIDLQNRRIAQSIAAFPLDNAIKRIAWSPDGKQIIAGVMVTGSFKGPDIVKIFDAQTGQQISSESVIAQGRIRILRYSSDGKYLAEGQIDDKIRIWDAQHTALLQEIPIDDHGMNLVFSKDGKFMAVTNGGTRIQIWKMKYPPLIGRDKIMATLLELAQMSSASYEPAALGSWLKLENDVWLVIDVSIVAEDHYYGVAYRNTRTGEIVIANRGTDPTSLKDLWSDFQLAAYQGFDAQDDAMAFAVQVAEKNPGTTIIETGHSLGGNEAAAAYAELCRPSIPQVSVVTFQAPGIPSDAAGSRTNKFAT